MATVICDVREDLRTGQEPYAKIMSAVSSLGPDDQLELLATFQPEPLYRVLGLRGFEHSSEPLPDGEWRVTFFRPAPLELPQE